MNATSYRLAHYRILENADGSLWWESYAGFARTQKGRCFIESNILFVGPSVDVGEPGFLIMEYNKAGDAANGKRIEMITEQALSAKGRSCYEYALSTRLLHRE